jgi:hypothetical protein
MIGLLPLALAMPMGWWINQLVDATPRRDPRWLGQGLIWLFRLWLFLIAWLIAASALLLLVTPLR